MRTRLARAALVLLLAGLALLTLGPLDLGTVRVAGVNLLWWYGGGAAPICAVLVTLAALRSRRDEGAGTQGSGCGAPPDGVRREPENRGERVNASGPS